MKVIKYFIGIILILSFLPVESFAQQRITTRGTSTFRKVGVHRGNQVRTVFSNYGVIAQPGNEGPRGAWKFDANGYVGDVSPLVGIRLPIADYPQGPNPPDGIPDTIYSVIITPVDRPGGGESGPGKSWTFEPIPGFANPGLDEVGKGVAMSHLPETWPPTWPDYPSWTYSGEPIIKDGVDVTPTVDWNGYFGRGQLNADQESYFWMDDNNDEEWFQRHEFIPDSESPQRRGAAIQVSVRGLQWSNFLAQDVIFWLYNIKNDGTSTYDQAVFGTLVGTYVGVEDPEWIDDASFFNVRESITYTWDFDNYISPSANPQWQPNPSDVGYIAYAFLESPGNQYDGIDNDGDNDEYQSASPFFDEDSFDPVTVQSGQKLILIDKDSFERTEFIMPNDTVTVQSLGTSFFLEPNVTVLVEGDIDNQTNLNPNAYDGIDNDLDGLIDENYLVHYRQLKKSEPPNSVVLIDTIAPVQYADYLSGVGVNDNMLDEARDDMIDNDNDWSRDVETGELLYDDQGHLIDDVGADGKPNTGDEGEYNGVPTPGEPNFDATDVDESDQLGLTSFQYFVPADDITMSNDPDMWERMTPGFFDVPGSIVNNVAVRGEDGDFVYGSGYFPLLPGKTERFSLALAFGEDFQGVLRTKQIAQIIYNANYNFPKPPEKPTVNAVPEDGKITLYWDKVAENSIDPTTKEKDFEGYKIYKGTDPDLTDALQITDGSGQKVFYKPIAQYDLINGIRGYFNQSQSLIELTNGAPFYLGSDNGVQNFFVDNDVNNGRTYYYAVVAYDRGKSSRDIFPSENTRFISKDALGRISTDINTVAVIPNAPVAGYVAPPTGVRLNRIEGNSTAHPYYEVVDPTKLNDSSYVLTFNDSLVNGVNIGYSYNVKTTGGNTVLENRQMFPDNGDVFNGIKLSIDTSYQNIDSVKYNRQASGWNIKDGDNLRITVDQFVSGNFQGTRYPYDYLFAFSDSYTDSSNKLTAIFGQNAPDAKPVNFKVFDITERNNPVRVQFGLQENNDFRRDTLSYEDVIILSDSSGTEFSWRVTFGGDSSSNVPAAGDSLFIIINKPLDSSDEFRFNVKRSDYDVNNAREQLDRIRVVPNPYVVTNVFEQPLPPQVRGRGERVINFVNLPAGAKIHIYTSSGNHIQTLEHDGNVNDGSVTWDVRTKEGLDVAYGVYFYVVEVPDFSEKKMGKIAIIK